jgi:putative peptidoglycan lipid II flippase
MIRKLFNLFHYELKGVHQAALLLGIAAILAKFLALLRDRFLASNFGAGETLDIYFAAFRVPDFIYTFSLFITASAALIPILLDLNFKDEDKARLFLSETLSLFFVAVLSAITAAFFFMPFLVRFVAPGFSGENETKLIMLSRILLLSPFLLGISNLFSSVIQSFHRFFIYALSPILYNLGIILGIIVFYPKFGINGLGWGVIIGAFLHFAIQFPSLIKLGFMPRLMLPRVTSSLKRLFKLAFPRTLGLSFNQLVLVTITASASLIGSGSIAVFNLSYNLQSIPLSIIGLSYSVAAFPTLARLFIKNRKEEFLKSVETAARHIIFWSLPFSALLIVLRAQVVRTILGAGAFGWIDTRLTAASLAIFSVSIAAQSLILLFVRSFYAAGKTAKPLLINAFSSLVIVISIPIFLYFFKFSENFNSILGKVFRVSDISNISILILPLAFSLGTILNVFLLWIYFQKDFGMRYLVLKKSLLQILTAVLIMSIVSFWSLRIFDDIFNIKTFSGIFLQGFLAGLLGVIAAVLILFFLKNKEIAEIVSSLRTKFWKAKVIVQEPDKLL